MEKISLFGYGKTTRAIAKLYKQQNMNTSNIVFFDDKVSKHFKDEDGFTLKNPFEFEPDYSTLEIPSPGMPPSHELIQKAKNLRSEYDYFADIMPSSVWISGTNGKTTTTQMMQYLLKDKGSQAGGNIGTPLAQLDPQASLWILETSSFTMHYTNSAKPNIYVLLPLSPDHLSWHGSMQEYVNAKLKPLKSMKEGEIAIIPKAYKDFPTKAHLICYENEQEIATHFGIDMQKVKFEGAFLMDALLAMAVDKILFDRTSYDAINSFVLDPHRQEEFKDTKSRLWVNDTKATNIDATLAALKRYKTSKIYLILGGDDKGVMLDDLFETLTKLNITTYHIGSNKQKLSHLAQKFGVEYVECKNLDDAITQIDTKLSSNEVALLSPAAASLDEFRSYADRGEQFKKAVQSIS